ncbi:phage tail protein, partial [Salmonella enterica subsp. enterica serovar Newport]|nr:phage tail protein [Salmonella enterica subsp. enterica serovar Newport]
QVDDIYIGAHSHTVSPGTYPHSHYLNIEYLSGVKNDV